MLYTRAARRLTFGPFTTPTQVRLSGDLRRVEKRALSHRERWREQRWEEGELQQVRPPGLQVWWCQHGRTSVFKIVSDIL